MTERRSRRIKPSEAYKKGRLAQLKGQTRQENPFEKGDPRFGPWDQGWKDRSKMKAKAIEVHHES